jgi:hypothetical protein
MSHESQGQHDEGVAGLDEDAKENIKVPPELLEQFRRELAEFNRQRSLEKGKGRAEGTA